MKVVIVGGVAGGASAADERILFLFRCLEPCDCFAAGQCFTIERQEMAACHKELAVYGGVHYSDDALVVGYLDFEIIVDFGNPTEHTFQLAVNINHVTTMQVELIVVVCQRIVPVWEGNLHNGSARRCCLLRHGAC